MSSSRIADVVPEGEQAFKDLDVVFLCDCSGSMSSAGKIGSLNHSLNEVIPKIRDHVKNEANVKVFGRAISFGGQSPSWHIKRTPIEEMRWSDLKSGGGTPMGAALTRVIEELEQMPTSRACPPVLILLTDGYAGDQSTFEAALVAGESVKQFRSAVRVAVSLGTNARPDLLNKFLSPQVEEIFTAHNADQLVAYIEFATLSAFQSASNPVGEYRFGPSGIVDPTMDLADQAWG
jgi:uncharacterized protein YegL